MRSWVCWLQVFNLLQIVPQFRGGISNQLLINERKQHDFQLAVFEIPPADDCAIYKNCRTDDAGQVEDITHMLLGQEQALCFLVAQHELIKASQEQAGGKLAGGQATINVEIGLAIHNGFRNRKLLHPCLDLGLGGAEEVGGILDGGGAEVCEIALCQPQPGFTLCHGFESGAKLIGFLFLYLVAEPTRFAKCPDRAAEGYESKSCCLPKN